MPQGRWLQSMKILPIGNRNDDKLGKLISVIVYSITAESDVHFWQLSLHASLFRQRVSSSAYGHNANTASTRVIGDASCNAVGGQLREHWAEKSVWLNTIIASTLISHQSKLMHSTEARLIFTKFLFIFF